MRKTRIATMGLLLLILLVALIPVMLPAKAYDYDYGAASELYSTDWLLTDSDLAQVGYAFPQIYWIFCDQLNDDYTSVYGHLWNQKSSTYTLRVESGIEDMETHPYATFFYYGHMGMENIGEGWPEYSYGFREQAAQDYQGVPPAIWDDENIYPNTDERFYFVFLWVCHNGNTRGYANPPHGMPFCWTHSLLSTDGYNDPDDNDYCFISFQNASCCLNEWVGTTYQGTQNLYKFWLVFFYYYAVEAGFSINDSLDLASQAVLWENGWIDEDNRLYNGHDFYWPGGMGMANGTYWGRMRIYGNGDNHLPTGVDVG